MNNVEIEGFVSYLEVKPMQNGAIYKFKTSLQSGKNQDGTYRKEYFPVQVGGQNSQQIGPMLVDGQKVKLRGRLRNRTYDSGGEKKTFSYVEAFEIEVTQQPQQQQFQPQVQGQYQPQNGRQYQPQQYQPQAPQGFKPQGGPPPQQQQYQPQQQRPQGGPPPFPQPNNFKGQPRMPQPHQQPEHLDDIPF